MSPLLSIVIPAYNAERHISNVLSMLINQNLDDCEVIVVNDGSDDGTADMTNDYISSCQNIRLISIPRSGVSVARNTGLENANGKYIYFLDSDDTLFPGTLDFFKKRVKQNTGVDVFVFGYTVSENNKMKKNNYVPKYNDLIFSDESVFLKLWLSKRIVCHLCSVVFRKKTLDMNNLQFIPGLRIGEDYEFLISVFFNNITVLYSSRPCYIYQLRSDSTMQSYRNFSIDQVVAFRKHQRHLKKKMLEYPLLSQNINFFISVLFCGVLRCYLRSSVVLKKINIFFYKNKTLLFENCTGTMSFFLKIYMLRFVPFKLLFCLFKK